MATSSKSLLVVDGFSVAFRAYFALPPTMTLKDGTPINAVFGFANLLFNAIDTFDPDMAVVCFDRPEPTFRHEMYVEYKAHRPPAPEDFIVQIPLLKSFITEIGIRILEKSGFEADDIMGTLSKMADREKVECVLMTGDKDALQLVSEHVSVAMNKKGDLIVYDPAEVEKQFDLSPRQIIDLKSLQGDASDNIPGVPGVGVKTATKLLADYPTLEEIYDHIEDISSKSVQTKLKDNKELAFLSKQLATINCAVPIDVPLSDLAFSPDWNTIIDSFHRYEFRRLAARYSDRQSSADNAASPPAAEKGDYQLVEGPASVKKLIPDLKNGFAIDLETTSKHAIDAQIVGIAISIAPKTGVYIPLNAYLSAHSDTGSIPLFSGQDIPAQSKVEFKLNPILKLLKPILEDPKISKYTQNGKYEWTVFNNYGITLQNIAFDTMLAAFLVDPLNPVGLKALAYRHLGIEMTSYEDVAGKGKEAVSFDQVPLEAARDYAAADADITYRLADYLKPQIAEKKLGELFWDIELPTQVVLAKMESEGVCLDTGYLNQLSKEFAADIDALKTQIFKLAGQEFNVNSPKQLGEILFDKLKLPVIKKTKTGRSTDSSVLMKLKEKSEIAQLLLDYRTLEKLQGTYVTALPGMVNPRTHRIHTSFNQTVAITGRLSSTAPNLQNIPIRTAEGFKIRKAFIPSKKDNWLLSADYSQIELRLMAQLSKDPKLITAFQNDEDIHNATAAIVYGIPIEDVTKEQRYQAKAVNFGIIYGQSAFGLSETIGVTRTQAKEIIDNYFKKFPNIQTFIDDTIAAAKVDKLVRTEFGRIRPLPEIDSKNPMRRQFAERTAVNTRLQGTAADIMKLAMVQVQAKMETQNMASRMIIQVHDELVFDVVPDEKDALLALVTETMSGVVDYDVPLKVDAEFGQNWYLSDG